VTTQVSNGSECLSYSGASGQFEHGHGSPKYFALGLRQDELRWLVGLGARKTPQEQQLPSNGQKDGQGCRDGVVVIQLTLLQRAARLESLEKFLDEPARAIDFRNRPDLLDGGDGLRSDEDPSHGLQRAWRSRGRRRR